MNIIEKTRLSRCPATITELNTVVNNLMEIVGELSAQDQPVMAKRIAAERARIISILPKEGETK